VYRHPKSWRIRFGLNQFKGDGSLITFLEVDRLAFGFVGLEPIGVEPILTVSINGFFDGIPTEEFVIAGGNAADRESTILIGSSR
jgi:hypothetical protein